jgi:hypothetical protein
MERINIKYERFRDVVMNTNTAISSEFKDLRKGITHPIGLNEDEVG